MKGRPLSPKKNDPKADKVMTPPALAKAIVGHFRPCGRRLEPCSGSGSFAKAMPGCDHLELDDGWDFFDWHYRVDWIVTNPPWSQLRAFLKHSMTLADNIVFLCTINHVVALKARWDDMDKAGFGVCEILLLDTPPKPWPQSGFQLGACWIRRGWTSGTTWSRLPNET